MPTIARTRVISLLLCLVTWRGPLPCLHEHHEGDPELARHLASYHALSHDEDEGWHVHLLLPFGRCPYADPDEDSSAGKDPLSVYGTLLTKCVRAPAQSSLPSSWHDVASTGNLGIVASSAAIQMHPPPNRPTSFLASLLASVPLRAVIGVALC